MREYGKDERLQIPQVRTSSLYFDKSDECVVLALFFIPFCVYLLLRAIEGVC
ncbi:hypothetical protein BDV93DRAFT_527337 [Ceratobasidium sp. AG-I]|nr:hypothetical protein BDV93DRAFT_527337 [Ceratobasidium sp. AG-I]